MAPHDYGDRTDVEFSGPDGGPAQVQTLADLVRAVSKREAEKREPKTCPLALIPDSAR